jgi:hypothetical protein
VRERQELLCPSRAGEQLQAGSWCSTRQPPPGSYAGTSLGSICIDQLLTSCRPPGKLTANTPAATFPISSDPFPSSQQMAVASELMLTHNESNICLWLQRILQHCNANRPNKAIKILQEEARLENPNHMTKSAPLLNPVPLLTSSSAPFHQASYNGSQYSFSLSATAPKCPRTWVPFASRSNIQKSEHRTRGRFLQDSPRTINVNTIFISMLRNAATNSEIKR